MKNLFYLLLILLMVSCQNTPKESSDVQTQEQQEDISHLVKATDTIGRFEAEITRFETLDKTEGIMKGGILFTGSSSIRMWSSLTEDMADYTVRNRGFGGATLPELLTFSERYIWKHQPDVIVLYCGENDIAEGSTAEDVFQSFQNFVKVLDTRLPNTNLVYITMKPSISRWSLWDKYQAGDKLIEAFIADKSHIKMMDVSLSMLQENGNVKTDIFIEDDLHLNAKGYAGWTAQLLPILKELED